MRKISKLLFISVCIIMCMAVFTGCSQQTASNTSKDTPTRIGTKGVISSEVDKEYTIKDSVKSADIVAEVEISEWLYETSTPAEKTFFNAKIINVLKNNINSNLEEIKIMQDGNSESTIKGYPLFAKGDKLLLFLKKSEDIEDTFWILGAHTSAIQIREENGRKYAIKFVGKLDELKNIEIKRSDEQTSKDLKIIDKELSDEISVKSTPELFEKGKYNSINERQVMDLDQLIKKIKEVV